MTLTMPPAPSGSPQQMAMAQYAYLFQMAQQLNLALGQLETGGAGTSSSGGGTAGGGGTGKDSRGYQELKSMIVKTAGLVKRQMDQLSARLEGADPFLRTAFCLEVFRERQLLTLRQEGDTISITLTGQGKHVRLEESGYLQGLHEVMQPKRGGDHHD